ncbi:hypothetical protein MSAN_01304100 [Mycena sanguinolenta]|uniref:Uncharacterized protein n=1 Tax=Mycena sanguinolenta TaxID=230812 RepID=A0A8H7D0J9_9AGAR|nr:hypothetical protein MSAN_01304100 [Mycena sanguinolenta]
MSPANHAALLNSAVDTTVFALSKTFTILVLYTVYVGLFLFSLYTIVRWNSRGRRFMLIISSGMFVLATTDMLMSVISWAIDIAIIKLAIQEDTASVRRLIRLYDNVDVASAALLTTNNLLTDLLFLYRCHVIWDSRGIILILPGAFILATCSLSFVVDSYEHILDPRVPYGMAGVTNAILTCLTAGRIWYKSREAATVNGNAFRRRYHTAIGMIVESGALYSLVLLLQIVAWSFPLPFISGTETLIVFRGVCIGLVEQMVNIIPTLIFVRVGMGYCQWNQEYPGLEVQIPRVRTPKLQEEAFPEDVYSEVIEIK